MFDDIAFLCKETITKDEYLNERSELKERKVFVRKKSVGSREFYQAATTDYHPVVTLVLADYFDYDNEKIVVFEGETFEVVRTYRVGNKLELTLQEKVVAGGGSR